MMDENKLVSFNDIHTLGIEDLCDCAIATTLGL